MISLGVAITTRVAGLKSGNNPRPSFVASREPSPRNEEYFSNSTSADEDSLFMAAQNMCLNINELPEQMSFSDDVGYPCLPGEELSTEHIINSRSDDYDDRLIGEDGFTVVDVYKGEGRGGNQRSPIRVTTGLQSCSHSMLSEQPVESEDGFTVVDMYEDEGRGGNHRSPIRPVLEEKSSTVKSIMSGKWMCDFCTFINPNNKTVCCICDAKRK